MHCRLKVSVVLLTDCTFLSALSTVAYYSRSLTYSSSIIPLTFHVIGFVAQPRTYILPIIHLYLFISPLSVFCFPKSISLSIFLSKHHDICNEKRSPPHVPGLLHWRVCFWNINAKLYITFVYMKIFQLFVDRTIPEAKCIMEVISDKLSNEMLQRGRWRNRSSAYILFLFGGSSELSSCFK